MIAARKVKSINPVITSLPEEVLMDLNHFVKVSNDLKRLARSCSPKVVEGAAKLERYKRAVIDSIRKAWLNQKRLDDKTAREAIDMVHDLFNRTMEEVTRELEVCLKK